MHVQIPCQLNGLFYHDLSPAVIIVATEKFSVQLQYVNVNFVGYLFEMQADTPQEAMMAVKFSYLGKPFIVLTMFLFAMECCKVRLPKWLPG